MITLFLLLGLVIRMQVWPPFLTFASCVHKPNHPNVQVVQSQAEMLVLLWHQGCGALDVHDQEGNSSAGRA